MIVRQIASMAEAVNVAGGGEVTATVPVRLMTGSSAIVRDIRRNHKR